MARHTTSPQATPTARKGTKPPNYEQTNRNSKTTPFKGNQVPGSVYRHSHRDGSWTHLVQCDAHHHHRKPIRDQR